MFLGIVFFILGVVFVFGAAFLFSTNRAGIRYKYLFIILITQLILAFIMLDSAIGVSLVRGISAGFGSLTYYAGQGTSFVFGGLTNMKTNGFVFFFEVLMPIVLISALIGILQFLKILPFFVKWIGLGLSKINGMGKLESFNAISSLTLGQSENFIAYKDVIGHLPSNVLYTMSATAMSTVSLSIVGAYMNLIDPKYVCVALIMNMFSTFFVLTVINPYEPDEKFSYDNINHEYNDTNKQSFFAMLSDYIMAGFKIAVIVAAMLIGFIALIAMLNGICDYIFGITFQDMLGYVFYPIAWLLHIPSDQLLISGQIIGTKIVANEMVAMGVLRDHLSTMSAHTNAVISVFLVSFANIGSIGIIVGAIQALNEDAAKKVAGFGLKILYGGILVSLLSAVVVGLFIQ